MQWIARILSVILLIAAAVPVVFDYDSPVDLTRDEVSLSIGFWVIVAGLIVALRFMFVGALLILTGVLVRVATYFVIVGPPWTNTFYPAAAVVGILYLVIAGLRPAKSSRPRLYWMLSVAAALILFGLLVGTGILNSDFFQTPWVYDSRETRAARTTFEQRETAFEVTLLPIHIIRGPNTSHEVMLTKRFAEFLDDMGIAQPVVSEILLEIPVRWGSNQARMFRRSRETFADRIQTVSIPTPYVLLVEILAGSAGGQVVGIHYYLADRQGHLVAAELINSHHTLWKELAPDGLPGAYDLLERWVCESWTLGDSKQCVKVDEPPRLLPHEVKRPHH